MPSNSNNKAYEYTSRQAKDDTMESDGPWLLAFALLENLSLDLCTAFLRGMWRTTPDDMLFDRTIVSNSSGPGISGHDLAMEMRSKEVEELMSYISEATLGSVKVDHSTITRMAKREAAKIRSGRVR